MSSLAAVFLCCRHALLMVLWKERENFRGWYVWQYLLRSFEMSPCRLEWGRTWWLSLWVRRKILWVLPTSSHHSAVLGGELRLRPEACPEQSLPWVLLKGRKAQPEGGTLEAACRLYVKLLPAVEQVTFILSCWWHSSLICIYTYKCVNAQWGKGHPFRAIYKSSHSSLTKLPLCHCINLL